jgi:hypothetical protein
MLWYKVETEANIGEPLFKLPVTVVLLLKKAVVIFAKSNPRWRRTGL